MPDQADLPSTVLSIGGRFGHADDAETPNSQIAVLGYASAPLIFEVRGLPRKIGERAMDAYRGVRIGCVIQCEGGYFAPGESGGGGVFDNQGNKITQFTSAGGGGHQANFIAAVRSRKESDLHGPIEGGHVSSALCHLANISYRLGSDQLTDAIREAARIHAPSQDSVARLMDHLEANGVATQTTPAVLGPELTLSPGAERFETKENYDPGFWANTMLRREYRKPFIVPENI